MKQTQAQKPKKYLWILSTLLPLVGITGVLLYEFTDQAWTLTAPLVFIYVFIPLLDLIFSTDESNPSEQQVADLERSAFYNWVLYLMLPLHFLVLVGLVYYVSTASLTFWMQAVLVLTGSSMVGILP